MHMNPFLIRKLVLLIFMSTLLITGLDSCQTTEPLENKTKLTKEEKTIIAMEKKEDEKARKEYDKAVKAHWKNQADNTRAMMKDAKRQQRRNNRIHQRSLWERLFGNSCNK